MCYEIDVPFALLGDREDWVHIRGMLRRPLSAIERFYNSNQTLGSWGLKMDDPKVVPELTEKFKSLMLGCYLSTTDTDYVAQPTEEPYVRLPQGISLRDSVDYLYAHARPDFSKRLFVIGTNNDTITCMGAHVAGDGGWVHFLVNRVLAKMFKSGAFKFPESVESLFAKQLKQYDRAIPHYFVDPTLTRFYPKRKVTEKFETCPYVYLTCDISELGCYNWKTKKTDGLTEALWTGPIFSATAFNNEIARSGAATCVDIRGHAGRLMDIDMCCCYANVNVSTTISPNQTIRELGEGMHKDMQAKLKEGYQFSFFKSLGGNVPPPKGIGIEMSNMGSIKIKSPIIDFFVRSTLPEVHGEPLISFSSYSIAS